MKQYGEIRKISTGQDDDYTNGCLLDFSDFEKNYRLIAVDLSKQKPLDADWKAIQQIIFTGKTDNQIRVYYILEQSKKTMLEFLKGTSTIIQSGGFLGSLLSRLAGPLMKIAIPLAKNVLAPLGITAAALAIDAGIKKKKHVSGNTTLIISNKDMNDIIKIIQAL